MFTRSRPSTAFHRTIWCCPFRMNSGMAHAHKCHCVHRTVVYTHQTISSLVADVSLFIFLFIGRYRLQYFFTLCHCIIMNPNIKRTKQNIIFNRSFLGTFRICPLMGGQTEQRPASNRRLHWWIHYWYNECKGRPIRFLENPTQNFPISKHILLPKRQSHVDCFLSVALFNGMWRMKIMVM